MIYELRPYTLIPGKRAEYLQLSRDIGRKVRGDKYGKFEGAWTTEVGTLNQYVHLSSFADLNERERLRRGQEKDGGWAKGSPGMGRPLMLTQENKILYAV